MNDDMATDASTGYDAYYDDYTSDPTSVDVSCLLESGTEGERGTLLCHLDYSDGDRSTAEIVVPPNGDWISHHVG